MGQVLLGNCLDIMPTLPPQSVDLVFGSPPYEDCRTYGIDFKLQGQDWVDWMVQVYRESLRVCKGLVAFVVEGKTRSFRWSATPALLMTDLHRAGITLRKPPAFVRSGIPGSGGPDWLRNDYEFIICATNGGKLPWADNTATGEPPKCKPGGDLTNRQQSGTRVRTIRYKVSPDKSGTTEQYEQQGGVSVRSRPYRPPEKANPGNVVRCSGGHMGSKLAHKNEAPFPESLAEFFIRSFCPPGGTVLDPFGGSGTTAAVAQKHGRNWITIDCRQSQIDLIHRRIAEVRVRPTMPTIK